MIKFFQKIRLQLLDKNKFSKYLLYAIGEIILVVIGILIALSINNWNQIQKKNKLRVSYQKSLVNDLTNDTLMLRDLIVKNQMEIGILRSQQDRILGIKTPIDTLIQIARNEFDPELNTRFQYNRNTFNTLIATGNIDLFDEDVNEKLMTLISLQDFERENSNYYSGIFASKISGYSDSYLVSGHQNSKIVDMTWTDIDEKKFASSFISLADIKGYTHYRFLMAMENVKKETTFLLDYIDKSE